MKTLRILLSTLMLLAFTAGFAANWEPQFEDNYIKLGSRWGACGGVTLRPTQGNVQVRSSFYSGFYKEPMAIRDMTWVELPPEGLRVRYDWGGTDAQSHYRIYCRNVHMGQPQEVPCKDYVALEQVTHNKTCGNVARWAGGTGAEYAPLNMSTDFHE